MWLRRVLLDRHGISQEGTPLRLHEADTRDFTQKTTLEKALLFDSVVKQFITKPDLGVIRGFTAKEEVEQLHSSWIDVS